MCYTYGVVTCAKCGTEYSATPGSCPKCEPPDEATAQAAWMRRVGATSAAWTLSLTGAGVTALRLTSLVLGPDPNAPPGEPLSTEPLPPVDRRHLAMAAGSRLVGRDRPSRS